MLVCKHEKSTPDDIVASIYTMAIPMFVKSLRFFVSHICWIQRFERLYIAIVCYCCNTPEIFDVLLAVDALACVYEPKKEKRNGTQITCPILYSHDWSTIAYTCENIWNVWLLLDCQTKSLINVNAKNSPSFSVWSFAFASSLFFFSFNFLFCFWLLEFESIEPILRFIIKIVTDLLCLYCDNIS